MARSFVKRTQRKIVSAGKTAAGRVQSVAVRAATAAATAAAQAAVDTVMRAIARELASSQRGQGGQQAAGGGRKKMTRKQAARRGGQVSGAKRSVKAKVRKVKKVARKVSGKRKI